jgi:hypothetical protein
VLLQPVGEDQARCIFVGMSNDLIEGSLLDGGQCGNLPLATFDSGSSFSHSPESLYEQPVDLRTVVLRS